MAKPNPLLTELQHFLRSRYGNLAYEITQTGTDAKGEAIISFDASEFGNIPYTALPVKLKAWFCEQMPGKFISVMGRKNGPLRVIRARWR